MESEVSQYYNKLRKLELMLLDQVIELTGDKGKFHVEAIMSLQNQISTI